MRKKLLFLGAVLVLLCVPPPNASADPITVNFDVTVRFARGALEDIFGVPIAAGDVIRGSFVYDPSTPDGNVTPDFGFYRGAGEALRLDTGTGLTLPIESYQVFDNANCFPDVCDAFLGVANTLTFPGFEFIQAVADFRTAAGNHDGDGLPQSLEELATVWAPGTFILDARALNAPPDDLTHRFSGTLRLRETPEPVPEPGTLMLIATGAAGLIARRRRPGSAGFRGVHAGSAPG
jgi:PEP-CTERM motif